jgi:hypothetical protein
LSEFKLLFVATTHAPLLHTHQKKIAFPQKKDFYKISARVLLVSEVAHSYPLKKPYDSLAYGKIAIGDTKYQ